MASKQQEELLEMSSGTKDLLERNNLRPLWEVEDDFGDTFGSLEADIWKWDDIQASIDGI